MVKTSSNIIPEHTSCDCGQNNLQVDCNLEALSKLNLLQSPLEGKFPDFGQSVETGSNMIPEPNIDFQKYPSYHDEISSSIPFVNYNCSKTENTSWGTMQRYSEELEATPIEPEEILMKETQRNKIKATRRNSQPFPSSVPLLSNVASSPVEAQDEYPSSVASCDDELNKITSMAQVIRLELKTKIQLKRIQEGKEEFDPFEDDPKKAKVDDISEETLKLQQDRRERNRLAAQKCRSKKKNGEEHMMMAKRQLENDNSQLKKEIEDSKKQYAHLLTQLNNRDCVMHYLNSCRQNQLTPELREILTNYCQKNRWQFTNEPCPFYSNSLHTSANYNTPMKM